MGTTPTIRTCVLVAAAALLMPLRAQEPRCGDEPMAVVSAGIPANRIFPGGGNGSPTLQRLDRDVLERADATHVLPAGNE